MLIYVTIFIASMIVAVVILFLYRAITNSSRSLYSSKERLPLIDVNPNYQKDTVTVNGMPDFPRRETHATPRHMAKTHPALPTETFDWGWKESGTKSQQRPGSGKDNAPNQHCSLYEGRPEGSGVNRKTSTGWPYREEKTEASGKVYKVKRKTVSGTGNPEDLNKPWGW